MRGDRVTTHRAGADGAGTTLIEESVGGRQIANGGVPLLRACAGVGDEADAGRGEGVSPTSLDPAKALHNRRDLMLMSLRDSGERAPLAQEIFDELAIAIVEGRLLPGETLNSVELSRRFRTSRTPVREALAELERQGVIVVPRRRQPYVAEATLQQIKDVYDLRASLFSLVSELIVDNCPIEALRDLWAWQEALECDAARGSVDDYFWHNVGFRLVEVRLAGNEELQRILSGLGMRTLQFRHGSLSQPGRLKRSAEDHRRLVVAYEERDRDTATAITRALIMGGYRALRRSELTGEATDSFVRPDPARL